MLNINYDPETNEVNVTATPQSLWRIATQALSGNGLFVSPALRTVKSAPEVAPPTPVAPTTHGLAHRAPKAATTHPDALAVTRFIRDWKHKHRDVSPSREEIRSGMQWRMARVTSAIALAVASNLMRVKMGGRGRGNRTAYDINTATLGTLGGR